MSSWKERADCVADNICLLDCRRCCCRGNNLKRININVYLLLSLSSVLCPAINSILVEWPCWFWDMMTNLQTLQMDPGSPLLALIFAWLHPRTSRGQGWLPWLRVVLLPSAHPLFSFRVQCKYVASTSSASTTIEEQQPEQEVPDHQGHPQQLHQLVD